MKRAVSIFSICIIVSIALVCIFFPLYCDGSFDNQALEIRNQSPSIDHWFGTDTLGRDIFLRVCVGGRNSLLIAFICTMVTTVFGCCYGGISALVTKLDKPMFVILDILVSIPDILVVLVLSLFFEIRGVGSICIVICVLGWCKMAKLSRDILKPLRNNDYVLQARLFGKGELSIVVFHLLPNILPMIASRAILSFSEFMFYESFLSYLGIGISPPNTSWGSLIYGAQYDFASYPYQLLYCLFLFCTLTAANCLGEALVQQGQKKYLKKAVYKKRDILSDYSYPFGHDNLILSVKDLCVNYIGSESNTSTVNKVSFNINKNEIVGLIGQSGCGKTTLARAISGIVDYYGGQVASGSEIYFNSNKVEFSNPKSVRAIKGENGIAIIHQDAMSVLDPTMKIGSQIMECFMLRKDKLSGKARRELAEHYLIKVGISEPKMCFNQYPYQLSGGIAQRVVIAMALAVEPLLLICDEPTASLDTVNQNKIIGLIKEIAEEQKMSVLFISHDMRVIDSIASRVLYMKAGEVKEITKAELPTKLIPQCKNIVDAHTSNTILRVEHLFARYPGLNDMVISDISFKLKPGETLGVLGESGSGKTTLVRAVIKSLVVNNYPLQIDNQGRVSSKTIKNIQYIFQNPNAAFDPHWKVGKSILEGGCDREKLQDLLRSVGLNDEIAYRYPSEISIGQCQRASIARAISVNPQLLICDEPTSSMDSENQALILELLIKLIEKRRMTCIFISHDPDVVMSISDRVAIMYKGKIVEIAPMARFEKISDSRHHPYTLAIFGKGINNFNEDNIATSSTGCGYYDHCVYHCERCKSVSPVLQKIGSETVEERHHFIACHLFDQYNTGG